MNEQEINYYLEAENRIRRFAITSISVHRIRVKTLVLIDSYVELGDWSAKHPKSIVAGAEYLARLLVGPKKNQDEIAKKYNVSIQTIRKIYNEILDCWEVYQFGLRSRKSAAKAGNVEGYNP